MTVNDVWWCFIGCVGVDVHVVLRFIWRGCLGGGGCCCVDVVLVSGLGVLPSPIPPRSPYPPTWMCRMSSVCMSVCVLTILPILMSLISLG